MCPITAGGLPPPRPSPIRIPALQAGAVRCLLAEAAAAVHPLVHAQRAAGRGHGCSRAVCAWRVPRGGAAAAAAAARRASAGPRRQLTRQERALFAFCASGSTCCAGIALHACTCSKGCLLRVVLGSLCCSRYVLSPPVVCPVPQHLTWPPTPCCLCKWRLRSSRVADRLAWQHGPSTTRCPTLAAHLQADIGRRALPKHLPTSRKGLRGLEGTLCSRSACRCWSKARSCAVHSGESPPVAVVAPDAAALLEQEVAVLPTHSRPAAHRTGVHW